MARELGITGATLTRHLNALEAKGYGAALERA
jgi:DNA-binding MarR family transcriptional regulator